MNASKLIQNIENSLNEYQLNHYLNKDKRIFIEINLNTLDKISDYFSSLINNDKKIFVSKIMSQSGVPLEILINKKIPDFQFKLKIKERNLELKDIFMYIPFGLTGLNISSNYKSFQEGVVDYWDGGRDNEISLGTFSGYSLCAISDFIPYLNPIIDFKNHKDIVDELSDIEADMLLDLAEINLLPIGGYCSNINYLAVQKMIEHKLDINGLIDQNLACIL